MFWLGERRGYLEDWITQVWVRVTGRSLAGYPQLLGPTGQRRRIGLDQPEVLAQHLGLRCVTPQEGGLLRHTATLFPGVHPNVAQFYDHTSRYDLQVWSAWRSLFKPFGGLLALLFSRRLEQMNMPLGGLDTAWGMKSEIVQLVDAAGQPQYTVWRRVLRRTGRVLFVGYYKEIPLSGGPGVQVTFPLPGGNLMVLMSSHVEADGSLVLRSYGQTFGGPGAYFTLSGSPKDGAVGRLIPMHEQIRVWADGPRDLRASHTFRLWRWPFLELHYLMRRQDETP